MEAFAIWFKSVMAWVSPASDILGVLGFVVGLWTLIRLSSIAKAARDASDQTRISNAHKSMVDELREAKAQVKEIESNCQQAKWDLAAYIASRLLERMITATVNVGGGTKVKKITQRIDAINDSLQKNLRSPLEEPLKDILFESLKTLTRQITHEIASREQSLETNLKDDHE